MSPIPGDRADSRIVDDEVKDRSRREDAELGPAGTRRLASMVGRDREREVAWVQGVRTEALLSYFVDE